MTEAGKAWVIKTLNEKDPRGTLGMTPPAEFWIRSFCDEVEKHKANGDPFPYLNTKRELLGE